jgi:hypothetical protein
MFIRHQVIRGTEADVRFYRPAGTLCRPALRRRLKEETA